MVVDEDKLKTTVKNLNAKIYERDLETSKMRQVLANLTDLEMLVDTPQRGDTSPPKQTIPTNVRTGKPFTKTEREKQYTDNMPRAKAFLP